MAATAERPAREVMKDLALSDPPPVPKKGAVDLRGQYAFARFTAQNDHYLGFYQQYTKTVLFLLGKHHLAWDKKKRRYNTDTSIPAWKQQLTTNVIYAVMRTVTAKLTKQQPALECVPPSGDSDDRASAHLAESLLSYLWRLLQTSALQKELIPWYLATGLAFIRVHWDEEAGEYKPLTQLVETPNAEYDEAALDSEESEDKECPCGPNGEPLTKEDGSYDFDGQPHMMAEGEIAHDAVSPFCIRVNPEAKSYRSAYEMYHADLWPKRKALAKFGIKEADLSAGNNNDERQYYEQLMSAAASGGSWATAGLASDTLLGVSQDTALGDQVLVIEYYRKPCKQYPVGRHWISIGHKKVWPKEDDTEYPNGEAPLPNGFWPPFIPAVSCPIPGQPQGIGALSQIVPLNEQLNTRDSHILEHEITMAKGGKWVTDIADKGMTINSDPAQVLNSKGYSNNRPPMQVKLNALPAEIYAGREAIMQKIQLVVSLSQVEAGQPPEGVTSGRAFLVLQEVTDSVWNPDLQVFESVWEEVGRRELVLAQRHYTEARTVKIRGERGRWEFRQFSGADIVDGIDVRVQAGSMAPWSKAAQMDSNIQLLTTIPQVVLKPDQTVDMQKLAAVLNSNGTGLLSNFGSDEDPTTVQTDREIAMFEAYTGQPDQPLPQIAFWQDHAADLGRYYEFMRRDIGRFDRWAPEAQEAFLSYMQAKQQAVESIAGDMVAANTDPNAGMGGPVGASDPNAATAQPGAPPPDAMNPQNPNESPALSSADMAGAQ